MNETEWSGAHTLLDMFQELERNRGRKWSARKGRLFACACCRRVWWLLTEAGQRAAVEVAERAADKLTKANELYAAHEQAVRVVLNTDPGRDHAWSRVSNGEWNFKVTALLQDYVCNPGARAASLTQEADPNGTANDCRALLHFRASPVSSLNEETAQCNLLRDLVGPVSLPVPDPTWLTWHDATVPKLAQAAYDERDLPSGHLNAGKLAILADALEEAGCTNEDVLAHLRGPGPHVRGCWVVDLLLGKE